MDAGSMSVSGSWSASGSLILTFGASQGLNALDMNIILAILMLQLVFLAYLFGYFRAYAVLEQNYSLKMSDHETVVQVTLQEYKDQISCVLLALKERDNNTCRSLEHVCEKMLEEQRNFMRQFEDLDP
jgi:hypothetical protein